MYQLIAIALGGATGAVSRYWIADAIYSLLGRGFPIATLFINVSGSFLMGLLTEIMLQRFAVAVEYRAAVLIGFLGAYTTFSTFALETLYLLESGSFFKAFLNILLSTCLCIGMCWFGIVWGRTLFTETLGPDSMQSQHYAYLVLGLISAFCLSLIAELICQYYHFSFQSRASVFILLLGILVILTTLSFASHLADIKLGFYGLLSLFVVNTLFGVAMVCLGIWVGNSLWQLKLSS